ncbi:sulfatase family protein [Actinopolymorpha rutila]|uniref:Arylsulfatase A-like enzyme n=1 Tax=Actinopolymorpha rutila TaxID=446787 RepID=A0A852ZTF8_9ACTN|nr:sulfatase-like hydrolase/transferase [Actinopolymorpha rutila]NYH92280.1 arylsulfatase A-like enzyme [Actinopolymorpha rutila]
MPGEDRQRPRHTPRDVVVVMTDQHRADLCAREGFGVDTTPTLDRLARAGRWFDRAYTSSPLCVPARISMLTGRFPSAHGVRTNRAYGNPSYGRDLVDVVAGAGFRTALVGKNHSHLVPNRLDHWVEYGHLGRLPRSAATGPDQEFDDWLHDHPGTTPTATPFPPEVQIPARLVDEAIRWLDTAAPTERSFLWLSIPEPHVPYQAPEPYFSAYAPTTVPPAATTLEALDNRDLAWRYAGRLAELSGEAKPDVLARARANYVGMLRLVDDQIARLVRHLENTGRLDDTLLVFVSDHGDFAGEYGLMRKGPGLPEVLARVPMFFHGPGVVGEPGPSPAHVSIVDILPTICEVLGQPVPEGVQGRSLVPMLSGDVAGDHDFLSAYAEQGFGGMPYEEADLGDAEPGVRRLDDGRVVVDAVNVVTHSGARRMVRRGRWKLVADVTGAVQLFDLAEDPFETRDLSAVPALAATKADLLADLTAWMLRATDAQLDRSGGSA